MRYAMILKSTIPSFMDGEMFFRYSLPKHVHSWILGDFLWIAAYMFIHTCCYIGDSQQQNKYPSLYHHLRLKVRNYIINVLDFLRRLEFKENFFYGSLVSSFLGENQHSHCRRVIKYLMTETVRMNFNFVQALDSRCFDIRYIAQCSYNYGTTE